MQTINLIFRITRGYISEHWFINLNESDDKDRPMRYLATKARFIDIKDLKEADKILSEMKGGIDK